ncbi:NADP-dependent oxidoreductase domain-containing protein [Tricharina praecox]|uniref:NADP-dependent oxidoreductase domain-containing protein n=1 Tax=Tricharina praecox TaxID=43433 RepID=UPI00221FA053|nr:NADP-dependent oxidoreductase domain-containing protein [Tricharina praecox]KAI5855754.1 NADP-dependent oxidoreductase domain-containing protein [Tricharina praecox]
MPTITSKPTGPIGFGLMGFTWTPTPTPDAQAFAAMSAALAGGANCWNAGEFYGMPGTRTANLELLNRYFTAHPSDAAKVVLSVKGGADLTSDHLTSQGDRTGVRRSVENVLRVLDGKVFLSIFECARVDKNTPIEETVAAIAEFVKDGRIGGVGLSEVSPETIRRAAKVHPIAAVEMEVSLWSREVFVPGGVADTCAELGIPIMAYSPLGRGILAGRFTKPEDLEDGDMRKIFDRFQPGNFEKNRVIVENLDRIAERKGCSKAQVCLAWVLAQGNKPGKATIVPLPGATGVDRVEENCKLVELSEEELEEVNGMMNEVDVHGGRYNEWMAPGSWEYFVGG